MGSVDDRTTQCVNHCPKTLIARSDPARWEECLPSKVKPENKMYHSFVIEWVQVADNVGG